MKIRAFLMVVGILVASVSPADEVNPSVNEFQAEFDAFTESRTREYGQFVDQADAQFSEWLDQAWESFRQLEPHRRDPNPKFPRPPVAPDTYRPEPSESKERKSVAVPAPDSSVEADFSFFGQGIVAPPWPGDLPSLVSPDHDAVARAWRTLSRAPYQSVLDELSRTCKQLACGDWARVLLARDYATWVVAKRGLDKSHRNLLTWFLLDKFGYRVRGGRFVAEATGRERLLVVYQPRQRVYGLVYFSIGGREYYPLEAPGRGRFFSYPEGFAPDRAYSRRPLTLDLSRSLAVKGRVAERTLSWSDESEHTITLRYDDARRRYLDEHPQVDLKWYFAAPVDPILAASVRQAVAAELERLTPEEKANRLLRFVQLAVPYEVDANQFGRETYLTPEQLLHYPAGDCEDRSVFYAALVKVLLGWPVTGVRYPGHVTAAVELPAQNASPPLDNGIGGNSSYIIADPSYIGADLGEVVARYRDVDGELIPL